MTVIYPPAGGPGTFDLRTPEVYFDVDFIDRLYRMGRDSTKGQRTDGWSFRRDGEGNIEFMVYDDAGLTIDDLYPRHRGRFCWRVVDRDAKLLNGRWVIKGRWPD